MITKQQQFISIGKVAKIIGVSIVTLRRWEKIGKIHYSFRTFGNHRRYDIYKIKEQFLKKNTNKTICYARVSSHDQKKDLETQSQKLLDYCDKNQLNNVELIKDLGSGLNFKKKGFKKLLNMIINQQFNHLIINHKDRLLRFGSEIIFTLCQFYNIKITIIEKSDENFEKELVTNVLEIITVFSSKLYGSRSHKNKKTMKQAD